ncbi:MAG: amidohydrolase, partial [Chitinophagaceae bacterium]
MKKFVYFFIAVLISIAINACNTDEQKADTIFFNAKVWTGDDSLPSASVVAIKGNQIIYVGDSYDGIKDEHTDMIDLQGKLLMPGLADNHTHFLSGGYNLLSVKLKDVKTKEGFIQTIKEYCAKDTSDSWILGGDWDHESWGGALPERSWVDSISGKHALFLSRYDGHMAFANTNAINRAGIQKNAVSPLGGTLIRTKDGDLSGVFKDEAMNLINAAIPEPNENDFAKYLETASNYALEHGVTLVNDMGSYGGWNDLNTYKKAKDEGMLKVRMYSFVPLNQWNKLDSFVKKSGRGDDMLKWGGLKGFVDGSLGSTTAWFY